MKRQTLILVRRRGLLLGKSLLKTMIGWMSKKEMRVILRVGFIISLHFEITGVILPVLPLARSLACALSLCLSLTLTLSRTLSLSCTQFNVCFIGMTIVTMYCQSIVFTVNIEHIHIPQKHACIHKKKKGKCKPTF